MDTYHEVQPI